ncbi:protein-disulfide reductase DsbD family protein [Pedobacter sp.]|uniref:protein-disulfide reductase DsbD family protein n=1 Tax=Pedobacter sp. TaxID=1411316 RepID=UPI003D7FC466
MFSTSLKVFIGLLLCCIFLNIKAIAQTSTDTSLTADIEFTDISETEGSTFVNSTAEDQPAAAPAAKDTAAITKVQSADASLAQPEVESSFLSIFITGFIGGLAALLMPCIFPMLPLTVSFFTKSNDKGTAFSRAALYGFFIILIYVVLGLIVTVIFGADALNSLSTNGIFNFLFFLLLVVFGISFLGAFEITLPSAWVNKMDANSDKGGIAGLFFMAGTLALVSFSCTGPIIGTLLVQAATSGALLGPAIGMFGFSFALAIPFALFALFPSALSALPKSGGWLNSVKVVLGFLELAFALKFLSNVDLAYHWEWFDREIFLVLWIVIFALMGLYLLGKLKFSHDSPLHFISVPRLLMAIVVLGFSVYMIPGLWGAPLKSISAFLPPQGTQDLDLYTPTLTGGVSAGPVDSESHNHKYSDIFHAPLNLNVFFDYDEGLAYAKKVNKPVMLDFTGHACVNCRKMEANVWPDKEVYQKLKNEYVIIQLYVDDKTDLLPEEKFKSSFSGKNINTIGNKWSDLQASRFNSNAQPFYVLLDHQEKVMTTPTGANYDPAAYLEFLQTGLQKFNASAK